jgi:hypothetical protein
VAYHDNVLYVADTYNHKIKKMSLVTTTSTTYLGSGKPGRRDGTEPGFYEPGGLSVAAGKLYIADTNNHAIRVADLATGAVTTLTVRGLAAPMAVAGFSDTKSCTFPRAITSTRAHRSTTASAVRGLLSPHPSHDLLLLPCRRYRCVRHAVRALAGAAPHRS